MPIQPSDSRLEQLLSPCSGTALPPERESEQGRGQPQPEADSVQKLSFTQLLAMALLLLAAFLCFVAAAVLLLNNNQNSVKPKIALLLPVLGAILFIAGMKPLVCYKKPAPHSRQEDPFSLRPTSFITIRDNRPDQQIFESLLARLEAGQAASPSFNG